MAAPAPAGVPEPTGGLSTNQKIAIGAGATAAAVAAAAVGAAIIGGGGYLIYNTHESKKQNAQPLKLNIRLLAGHNLLAADNGGTSDPYVEIEVGKFGIKSSVIKKTLNPVWNQEFSFGVFQEQFDKGAPILIRVFDEDFGKDDKLGHAEIPLNEVTFAPKNFDVTLKDVSTGTISLQLWLTKQA